MTDEEDNKSNSSTEVLVDGTSEDEPETTGISPKSRKKEPECKFWYYWSRLFLIMLIVYSVTSLIIYLVQYFQVFDPCDDFYAFACRSSNFNSQLAEALDFFSSIEKKMLENPDTQNIAEEKAHNFYKSCLKATTNPESTGFNKELEKMLDKLKDIPNGNLQEKLELLHNEYGLSPFFTWGILQDEALDINVIAIFKSGTNMFEEDPKETGYFTKQVKSSNKIKTMIDKMLGNRLNFTEKFDDFDELIELDKEMEKMVQPPLVNASDGQYHMMNLTQLQNLTTFINWKDFFNNGLNLTINNNEKIVVWCPQFLSNLSRKIDHLQKTRVESGKLLNKFLMWQAGKEIFGKMIMLSKDSASTVKYCSSMVLEYFKFAVMSVHRRHVMKKYPDLETRFGMVQEMVVNIRQELILSLKEAQWLDEKSREDAILKAEETGVLIGYPDVAKNSKLLEEYYEFYPQMNETDFVGNLMNLFKVDRHQNLKSLRESPDKNGAEMWPFARVVGYSAAAMPEYNLINLPVSNLLPPHFSPELPLSFNYGRVGLSIGHELMHCYQKFGYYSDNNKSTCFVRQYSNFTYPDGEALNGTHTLMENFADNGGFDIATRALFRELDKNSSSLEKDDNSEKLRNTNEKLFFSSFTEEWCWKSGLSYWKKLYSTDVHSPHEFRVLGILQNSPSFSNAFNCPLQSPMNPEQKCSIF